MQDALRRSLVLVTLLASLLAPPVVTLVAPAAAQHGGMAANPSLPDLAIDPVQGPDQLGNGQSAVYSVSVRNSGDPAASIWLQIDLDAPVTTGGTILAGHGFFCIVEPQRYLCDGGALATGEATMLTFDVRGSDAGRGAVRVSASVNGTADQAVAAPYAVTVAAAPIAD